MCATLSNAFIDLLRLSNFYVITLIKQKTAQFPFLFYGTLHSHPVASELNLSLRERRGIVRPSGEAIYLSLRSKCKWLKHQITKQNWALGYK